MRQNNIAIYITAVWWSNVSEIGHQMGDGNSIKLKINCDEVFWIQLTQRITDGVFFKLCCLSWKFIFCYEGFFPLSYILRLFIKLICCLTNDWQQKKIYSGSQYENTLSVTLTCLPTRNKVSLVTAYLRDITNYYACCWFL
jgi:hypothetical protein